MGWGGRWEWGSGWGTHIQPWLTHVNVGGQTGGKQERQEEAEMSFVNLAQLSEIEENNKMGKTRDLFKKIRDTKGKFHAKMGSIKDRNGMDLTEAEIWSKEM